MTPTIHISDSMPIVIAKIGGVSAFMHNVDVLMQEMFAKYNLHDWNFRFDSAKSRAGCCVYSSKTIVLSTYFATSKYVTLKQFFNIIFHELAHALTPGHCHDGEWKRVAQLLGSDGERMCPSFLDPEYIGVCKCRQLRYRFRIAKHKTMTCRKCREEVRFSKFVLSNT